MPTPQELLQMAQAAGVQFPALPQRLQAAIASGRMDEATARQRALQNAPQYRAAMGLPNSGGGVIPAVQGGYERTSLPAGAPADSGGRIDGGGLQGAGRPRDGGFGRMTGGGLQGRPGGQGASFQGTPTGLPPGIDPGSGPGVMGTGNPAPGAGGGVMAMPMSGASKEGQGAGAPPAPTGFVPRMRPMGRASDSNSPGVGGTAGGETRDPMAGPSAAAPPGGGMGGSVQPKPQLSDLAAVTAGVPPVGVPPVRRRPPIQRPTNRGVYAF